MPDAAQSAVDLLAFIASLPTAMSPVELRRLSALEAYMSENGYSGGANPPLAGMRRTGPNTVVAMFNVGATVAQRNAVNAAISGWQWADPTPVPTLDMVVAMAAEAKAAANQASAANLPYWAGQVVSGADGKFTIAFPRNLFTAETVPVVLATPQPSVNTDRPHTVNLLTVSATGATGYVSFTRPLPSGLLNVLSATLGAALNSYDTSQPAPNCTLHIRAGYPKLT